MDDLIFKKGKPLDVLADGDNRRIAPAEQGAARLALSTPELRRRVQLWFSPVRIGMPALLLAVTVPTTGCYLSHERSVTMDAGRPDTSDAAPDVRRDIFIPPDTGPPPWCFTELESFAVEIPLEGVPAEAALICAEPGALVSSGLAARVVLRFAPGDRSVVRGTIMIADPLVGGVVDIPRIDIVDARYPFDTGTPSAVEPVGTDFGFEIVFPTPIEVPRDFEPARMTVETRFEVDCGPEGLRTVVASTVINLCQEEEGGEPTFVSSGDECTICVPIFEAAPTPSISVEDPGALPLAHGMQLGIRPVARFQNAIVLLAEHDKGSDATYRWQSTGGELHTLMDDVVVWTPPESQSEAHMVQLTVETKEAAAVASFRRGAGV